MNSGNFTVDDLTASARRSFGKRVLHLIRRAHLYLGLALLPWSLLYGVTAFLFNHPTAFSDQPTRSFGRNELAGTPLETVPSPLEQADQVVKLLNEKLKPAKPYTMAGDAKYTREFAFATVKGEGRTVGILVDVTNHRGTVRVTPTPRQRQPETAPFTVVQVSTTARDAARSVPPTEGIKLDQPMHERVKAAIPTILERTGFETGEVTVTSVPEITFPIEVEGQVWTATYNPMTGAVSGKRNEEKPELSVRSFLLRLHVAHGYPGETNARWFWAVIVDVMAAALCLWGLSGLLMWWQLRATRKLGLVVLVLSTIAATTLGVIAHAAMSG